MSEGVLIAVANGSFSLIGVIATVWIANNRTIYRIDELEKKVEKHNRIVERTIVLEERAKEVDRRLGDIEKR